MPKKALIRDRGELPVIIRTLRPEAHATVAVYHRMKPYAPHFSMLDVAVELEADTRPPHTWPRPDHCLRSPHGADAIHRIRLFSETPVMPDSVENAGFLFIAPSAPHQIMWWTNPRRARSFGARSPYPRRAQLRPPQPRHSPTAHPVVGFRCLSRRRPVGAAKAFVSCTSRRNSPTRGGRRRRAQRLLRLRESVSRRYIESARHIEVQILGWALDVVHLCERMLHPTSVTKIIDGVGRPTALKNE